MAFRTYRDPNKPVWFSSWDAYLEGRGGGKRPALCTVIREFSEPVREQFLKATRNNIDDAEENRADAESRGVSTEATDRILEQRRAELARDELRYGFPWVTPILGNGCLSVRDDPRGRRIDHAPERMAKALADERALPNRAAIGPLVKEYAAALLDEHDPRKKRDVPDVNSPDAYPTGDDILAARAALVAVLLGRMYHSIAATSGRPTPRAAEAELTLDTAAQSSDELVSGVVEPLITAIGELEKALGPQTDARFVRAVVSDISAALTHEADRPQVRRSDMYLMSEITWYFMTRGTQVYPGWSDLILMMSMKAHSERVDRKRKLPWINDLNTPLQWIKDDLEAITRESWELRNSAHRGKPTERDRLYDSVAAVLTAQARLLTQTTDPFTLNPGKSGPRSDDTRLPVASAFVTSFDLELEMALAMQPDPLPFVMVAPLQASIGEGEARRAVNVWLGARIDPASVAPAERLDLILNPTDWRLLRDGVFDIEPDLKVPVVVRLAGSPLITAPTIGRQSNRGREGKRWKPLFDALGETGDVAFSSAVLLDEYTSINHAATEFGDDQSQRLPRELSWIPEEYNARYWLVLGVQLADSGIRHRLAAQFGSLASKDRFSTKKPYVGPVRAGAVVNRRSRPTDRDILNWQGFDVVESDYSAVADDLDHYLLHLLHPDTPRIAGSTCQLQGSAS